MAKLWMNKYEYVIFLQMFCVFPGDCCTQTLPAKLPDVKWDLPEKVCPRCSEKNHTLMKVPLTQYTLIKLLKWTLVYFLFWLENKAQKNITNPLQSVL